MANLLFLVHRMPYLTDQGDKVRSQDDKRFIIERIGVSEVARSIGVEGRRRVLASYTWAAHMSVLNRNLETCAPLVAV